MVKIKAKFGTSELTRSDCLALSFIFFFLLFCNPSGYCQLQFKVLDSEVGLSNNNISKITQDNTGYLWIGTFDGLNRFDGYSFKVFKNDPYNENSITGNFISALAVDKFNRIWMGHNMNWVTCYDQVSDQFTRYKLLGDTTTAQVASIDIDRQGHVWIGLRGNGVILLNPKTKSMESIQLTPFINKGYPSKAIPRFNSVFSALSISDSVVMLATYDGLYKYNKNQHCLKPIPIIENRPDKRRNDMLQQIMKGQNEDSFWLSSYQGGVIYYDHKNHATEIYKFDKPITEYANITNDIAWKEKDQLWIASRTSGLGIFDIPTKTFKFFTKSDIFNLKEYDRNRTGWWVSDLFLDREKILWAGTEFGLLKITNKENPCDYRPVFESPPNFDIRDVVEDTLIRKKFFATGFGRGLLVSDENESNWRFFECETIPSPDDIKINIVQDLLSEGRDSLWVVTRDNIRLFDKVRERWMNVPQLKKLESSVSPLLQKIVKAHDGYWITSARNGVYYLKASDYSLKNYTHDSKDFNSISSNATYDIALDKLGRPWFATAMGISIYNPAKDNFVTVKNIKEGNLNTLALKHVSALTRDHNGNIWVGTSTLGIIKVTIVNEDSLSFETFKNDRMPSTAYSIENDRKGRIWFATYSGVSVLDPQTGLIRAFGKNQCLTSAHYHLIRSNDQVLINAGNGYITIDETDICSDTSSTQVVINSVKVLGKELFPSPKNGDHIFLPYNQNSIAINFAALNFLDNKDIRYSYKLEGTGNSEWSSPSDNRTTEFADLNGGTYVFRLKATNPDGMWTKNQINLYIHIETPFWESRWFYTVIVVGFSAVAFGVTYSRINSIKRREQQNTVMNKKMAEMELSALRAQINPHFLFNSLTSINRFIVKAEPVKASEYLINFSRLIRLILEASREQYIPLSKEIIMLDIYLELESYRSSKPFKYRIDVADEIDKVSTCVPSMVIQPYLENAIWHGLQPKETEGRIEISVSQKGKFLQFIIEDDGIGREAASSVNKMWKKKSYGMKITQDRLRTLNTLMNHESHVDIIDLKDQENKACGTRVILMLEFTIL